MRTRLGFLLALGVLLAACGGGGGGGGTPPGGDPIPVVLQNDNYEPGFPEAFVTNFAAGTSFGATLGPAPVDMTLDRIDYRWGPAGVTGNFILSVYVDTGTPTPGPVRVTVGRQLTSAADVWQTFDITNANILLAAGESVRFVIEFQASQVVGPARDGDGNNTAGRNWVESGDVWTPSADSGIPGDWIVRGYGILAE